MRIMRTEGGAAYSRIDIERSYATTRSFDDCMLGLGGAGFLRTSGMTDKIK